MKNFAMRKAAELKSALVAKEAANNSTEIVIIVLVVVVIAIAVGLALKTLLTDSNSGLIKNIQDRINAAPGRIDPSQAQATQG